MPKLTRIYTRTGDDGTTGLVGGSRVSKNDPRIDAYGTVDELSSFIGVARSYLSSLAQADAGVQRLDAWLAWTQDVLFNLGAELATPVQKRWEGMPLVSQEDAAALERAIDEAQTRPAHTREFHPSRRSNAGCIFARCSHGMPSRRAFACLPSSRRTGHLTGLRTLRQPALRCTLRLGALAKPPFGRRRAPLECADAAAHGP